MLWFWVGETHVQMKYEVKVWCVSKGSFPEITWSSAFLASPPSSSLLYSDLQLADSSGPRNSHFKSLSEVRWLVKAAWCARRKRQEAWTFVLILFTTYWVTLGKSLDISRHSFSWLLPFALSGLSCWSN